MARRPGVLAALAGACALAVVALWFTANDLAAGRTLDAGLSDALHGLVPASTDDVVKGLAGLGDPLPIAVGALALVALAWLRGGRRLAIFAAGVPLLANVVTQVAQAALDGSRRLDLSGTTLEGGAPWPSGHGTAAMSLALVAIVVAGPRLRPTAAPAGVGFALVVGGAMAALGGHLLSDVLAGYLVAAAFAAAGTGAYALLERRRAREPADRLARSPRFAPALGILAGAAVLATGIGKAIVTRRDEVANAIDSVPLALGAMALLGAVVVLGAGAALVLRR